MQHACCLLLYIGMLAGLLAAWLASNCTACEAAAVLPRRCCSKSCVQAGRGHAPAVAAGWLAGWLADASLVKLIRTGALGGIEAGSNSEVLGFVEA
jgi:hypothetical protein